MPWSRNETIVGRVFLLNMIHFQAWPCSLSLKAQLHPTKKKTFAIISTNITAEYSLEIIFTEMPNSHPPPHSHTHTRIPPTHTHTHAPTKFRMRSLIFLYFSLVFNILYKFSRVNHESKFYSVEMHFPSLPDVFSPLWLCHLPVCMPSVWSQKGVKEKVEFWEEVKNNMWALSFLLCKNGRKSVKTCSLKSMALQMPLYSKYVM